jgi:hypothetical protein
MAEGAGPPFPNEPLIPHMTHPLEDFQTLGLDYFQRWIFAGYDITIGHGDDGHFIEIAAKGGIKARFSGYDSLAGLLTAFLITIRHKYPLTAPHPRPVLNPAAWEHFRQVTELCRKAASEGLAPDTDAAFAVIYNMGKEQFLAFRGEIKLSRVDFKPGQKEPDAGDSLPLIPPPPASE